MSVQPIQATRVLSALPIVQRDGLIAEFNKILRNYREGRWEPAELDGGRFCEVAYSVLAGYTSGHYEPNLTKPDNLYDACLALAKVDALRFTRAVRIQIPRMLIAMYEIRNNRGVGHVGGDVNPNHMDSIAIVSMAKWIVCEFIRLFHSISIEQATVVVEAIIERELPVVWRVGENLRVLNPAMSKRDQTLLLLYSANAPVAEQDLVKWVEHSNASTYRRDVLVRLHKSRLIEYDRENKTASLSPLGIVEVEGKIMKTA